MLVVTRGHGGWCFAQGTAGGIPLNLSLYVERHELLVIISLGEVVAASLAIHEDEEASQHTNRRRHLPATQKDPAPILKHLH